MFRQVVNRTPIRNFTRAFNRSSIMSIPSTQKVIQIHETGGNEVLRYEDAPVPKITDTQVLVKNAYAGVNFIESYFRSGIYPAPLPLILGREGAGEVVQVGSKVTNFAVGDHVGYLNQGAYAQFTAVESGQKIVKVPSSIDLKTIGAGLLQSLTAYSFTKEAYPIQKGDTVLVWAAAGGTGALLVQFAKLFGAKVIGVTSSPEKAEIVRAAGADYIIDYKKEDVLTRVKELTNGKGVNAVYDGVGKSTWETTLQLVARKGTIVSFGNASGLVPPVSLIKLTGNIRVIRPSLFNYLVEPEEWKTYSHSLIELINSGDIKINISKIYPLRDFGKAIDDLQSGQTTGKLLVEIDDNK